MNNKYFAFLLATIILAGCSSEKKRRPVFYDSEDTSIEMDSLIFGEYTSPDYDQMADTEIVSIPFTEKSGVKYVKVTVNGLGFEMVFDTGCFGTLISVAEANYLYQKGYLTKDDILGVTQSQIADGSIVENMVINLKEVILDGKIRCADVTATVSANNNAPLLLGNEILNRVAAYAVDNQNHMINFKLK